MENAQKIQSLLGGNPMIKNVLSNPEHMKNAQKMLQSPDVQKQIGGLISNPKVIQQASQVLSGLQQINSTQAGGRKSRRRRKSTKKRRRKGGVGWRFGSSGTLGLNKPCKRLYKGSQCDKHHICKKNYDSSILDPNTNEKASHVCKKRESLVRNIGANIMHLGMKAASTTYGGRRTRRRRKRRKRGGISQDMYENMPQGCQDYGEHHWLCKFQQGQNPVPLETFHGNKEEIEKYCNMLENKGYAPADYCKKGGRKRKRRRTKTKKRRRKSKRRRKRTKKKKRRRR